MIPHHQTLRHTIHTPNTQTTYISRKATAFEEIYEARAKPGSHVTSWESCQLRDVAGSGEGDRRRLESVALPPVRRKTPWKLLQVRRSTMACQTPHEVSRQGPTSGELLLERELETPLAYACRDAPFKPDR